MCVDERVNVCVCLFVCVYESVVVCVCVCVCVCMSVCVCACEWVHERVSVLCALLRECVWCVCVWSARQAPDEKGEIFIIL